MAERNESLDPNAAADDDTPPWERGAAPEAPVGTSDLAKRLSAGGTFDLLSTRNMVDRRAEEEKARQESNKGLLEGWGTLDEKGRKDWVAGEKSWADTAGGFWQGVRDRLTSAPADGSEPQYTVENDPVRAWLVRKAETEAALARHRKALAEEMERGEREAPKYGNVRAVPESIGRGVTGIGASLLKGLGDAASYFGIEVGNDGGVSVGFSAQNAFGRKMTEADKTAFHRFGDVAEAWGKAAFPQDPARQHEFTQKFAEGAGSMVAFMGPGLAARVIAGAGPATMTAISGVTGAFAQSGSMAEGARKAARSGKMVDGVAVGDDAVAAAFLLGLPVGASEALPLAHLFSGSVAGGFVKRVLVQAAEEGGQEFGQQIAENLVARAWYDDKRHWDDNAWEGLAIGSMLGAKTQAAADLYNKARGGKRDENGQPLAQEARARAGSRTDAQPAQPGAQPESAPAAETDTPSRVSKFAVPQLEMPKAKPEETAAVEPAGDVPRMAAMAVKALERGDARSVIPQEAIDYILQTNPELAKKLGLDKQVENQPAGPVQVGDAVQWTSNGVDQFEAPRKIVAITPDNQWAMVEGSNTGIALAELSRPTPPVLSERLAALPAVEETVDQVTPAQIAVIEVAYAERGLAKPAEEEGRTIGRYLAAGLKPQEAIERYAVEQFEAERQARGGPEIGAAGAARPGQPSGARTDGRTVQGVGQPGARSGQAGQAQQAGQPQRVAGNRLGRGLADLTAQSSGQAAAVDRIAQGAQPRQDVDQRLEDALRKRFRQIIAGKTPKSKWATLLRVDQAKLDELIGEAVAQSLLRVDRNGVVKRTASAKVAPRETAIRRPTEALSIPADMRVGAAVRAYEIETGKPISERVRTLADGIEAVKGTPRFAAVWADIKAVSKQITKAEAVQLAYLVGFRPTAKTSKAQALASIEKRHEELAKFVLRQAQTGQVLAAIRGEAEAADAGQSQKRELDRLGYYSQALEAAKSLKQAKGTAEQMRAQLRSAGVKEAEILATGLDEFFASRSAEQARGVAGEEAGRSDSLDAAQTNTPISVELHRGVKPNGASGDVQFWTDDRQTADLYTRRFIGPDAAVVPGAKVETKTLRFDHPLVVDAPGVKIMDAIQRAGEILGVKGARSKSEYNAEGDVIAGPEASEKDIFAAARAAGHDAIVFKHPQDVRSTANQVVVLTPQRNDDRSTASSKNRRPVEPIFTRDEIVSYLRENRVEVREEQYSGRKGTNEPVSKWQSYSIDPSNPTYRETVIHLPGRPLQEFRPAPHPQLRGLWTLQRPDGTYLTRESADGVERPITAGRTEAEAARAARERNSLTRDPNDFATGHWSEPNVIAHARTSLQKTSDGKSAFLIDELQSDWGQKLRDGGARDEAKITELKRQLEAAQDELQTAMDNAPAGNPYAQVPFGFDKPIPPGAEQVYQRVQLLGAELRTAEAATPGHPLVNTTDQWTTTAFRRLIRQAVEAGADYIALTPGKVQADRFGLERQLDSVDVRPADDGHSLTFRDRRRNDMHLHVGKDGNVQVGPAGTQGKPLAEVVGRELADRIMAMDKPRTLTGFELSVGGEGMKATYDSIYPRTLGKMLAKMDPSIKMEDKALKSSMDGRPFAQTVPDNLMGGRRKAILFHTFPLTEKVKEQVLGDGQALFSLASRRSQGSLEGGTSAPVRTIAFPKTVDPPIASYAKDTEIKAHADYKAAKGGDAAAAARLVVDVVKPETVQLAGQRFGADAIYAPVIAREAAGDNAIPEAVAHFYAGSTGAAVADQIVQVSRAYHTGARPLERLISRPQFDGDVIAGGRYVLVDDVSVMGGTLAELSNFIHSKGGTVVGTITLVNASRNGVYTPKPQHVKEIEARYGDIVRQDFGIEPAALTADEASYILNFRDADGLRNSIAKAKGEREQRLLSKGIRPEGGGGVAAAPETANQGPERGLFSFGGEYSGNYSDRFVSAMPAVAAEIEREVARMLPADVAVVVKDRIFGPAGTAFEGYGIGGMYEIDKRLMQLSLVDGAERTRATGRHEVVHVLREIGLFTEQEWTLLLERAAKVDIDSQITMKDGSGRQVSALSDYAKVYAASTRRDYIRKGIDFSDDMIAERVAEFLNQERVAKLAEMYEGGASFGATIDGLLARIGQFLEAVRNALRGLGFQTADDIFAKMVSGEVADRADGGRREPTFDPAQAAREVFAPEPVTADSLLASPVGQVALEEALRGSVSQRALYAIAGESPTPDLSPFSLPGYRGEVETKTTDAGDRIKVYRVGRENEEQAESAERPSSSEETASGAEGLPTDEARGALSRPIASLILSEQPDGSWQAASYTLSPKAGDRTLIASLLDAAEGDVGVPLSSDGWLSPTMVSMLDPGLLSQHKPAGDLAQGVVGSPKAVELAKAVKGATSQPSTSLDMSPATRKARAEKMGFDTSKVWYHGTGGGSRFNAPEDADGRILLQAPAFEAFRDSKIGTRHDSGHYGRGHYLVNSAGEASYYGEHVSAYYVRGNYLDLDNNTGDLTYAGHFKSFAPKLDAIGALGPHAKRALEAMLAAEKYVNDNVSVGLGRNTDGSDGYIAKVPAPPGAEKEYPYGFDSFRGRFHAKQEDAIEAVRERFKDEIGRYHADLFPGLGDEPASLSDYIRAGGETNAGDLTDKAKAAGYDGVSYGDELVVFDPANIRSVNAAFDPAQEGSPVLLASLRGRPPKVTNPGERTQTPTLEGGASDPVRGLSEIIKDIKTALGMPLTQGVYGMRVQDRSTGRSWRFPAQPNLRGQYDKAAGIARVRTVTDIDAIAHEGGHHLEVAYGQALEDFKVDHAEELTQKAAPDRPMPPINPQGFSGLDLDADTQSLLVKTAQTLVAHQQDMASGGERRSAFRFGPQQAFNPDLQLEAAKNWAALVRRVGRPQAEFLTRDIIAKGLADPAKAQDLEAYVMERYSMTGQPQPRVAAAPSAIDLSEGFAEFFRRYLTDPDNLRTELPSTYSAFEEFLDAEDPRLLQNIERLQLVTLAGDYKAYLKASAVERGIADVATWQDPTTWEKIKEFFKTDNRGEVLRQWMSQLSFEIIDKTNPIRKTEQALLRIADENGVRGSDGRPLALQPGEKASMIARLMAGSDKIGHEFIMSGVPDYNSLEAAGPSLHDALVEALGGTSRFQWSETAVKRFGLYLEAKRAIVEWARYQAGELDRPPTRKSFDEYFQIIKDLDKSNPSYKRAAQMVYDWQHSLLTLEWQAGKWTDEAYQALSARKDWYVPFMRDLDDALPSTKGPPGSQMAKRFTDSKKFKGSSRDIINPIEAMVKRAYETAAAVQFNDMVKALTSLSEKVGPGGAGFIERVQQEEVLANNERTFERIKDIAVLHGMDEADAHLLVSSMEMNFDDASVHLLWDPDNLGPNRPPIVPLWENGERKLVRLNDPVMGRRLFDAMNALGREQTSIWIKAIGYPAAVLRAGVTMHPAFVMSNILGDMQAAWALTGALPVVTQVRGAFHLLSTNPRMRKMFDAVGLPKSMVAEVYSRVGGISGGQNVAALRSVRHEHDMTELRAKGYRVLNLPAVGGLATTVAGAAVGGLVGGVVGATLGAAAGAMVSRMVFGEGAEQAFAQLSEMSETISRLGVASMAMKRAKRLNPGMSDIDAAREGAFTARDVLDFDRNGAKFGTLMKLIPFLNSNVQGVSKAYRQLFMMEGDRGQINMRKMGLFLRHQIAGRNGQVMPISEGDAQAIRDGARVWVNVMIMAAVGAAIFLLHKDDPEYKGIADEKTKATHWVFKLFGKWYRVKKPFELAASANITQSVLEHWVHNDPRLWSKIGHGLKEVHTPPYIPQTARLYFDLKSNYDSTFDRPIVRQSLSRLPIHMQFDAYTSEFAKQWSVALHKIGVDIAPAKIDYALNNSIAYWGREIGVSSNYFMGRNRESPKWTDVPIAGTMINRVTIDPARRSESVDEFWKIMGQGRGQYDQALAGYDNVLKSGNPETVKTFLAGLSAEERTYAVLNKHFKKADQEAHPLNRAKAIIAIDNTMRREMILGQLLDTTYRTDPQVIALSPAKQTEVHDILGRLSAIESWNALHDLGHPGWAQREVRNPSIILDELKASDERVYDELMRRRKKAKVGTYEEDRERWKDLQGRVDEMVRDEDMLGLAWRKSERKRRTPAPSLFNTPPESMPKPSYQGIFR